MIRYSNVHMHWWISVFVVLATNSAATGPRSWELQCCCTRAGGDVVMGLSSLRWLNQNLFSCPTCSTSWDFYHLHPFPAQRAMCGTRIRFLWPLLGLWATGWGCRGPHALDAVINTCHGSLKCENSKMRPITFSYEHAEAYNKPWILKRHPSSVAVGILADLDQISIQLILGLCRLDCLSIARCARSGFLMMETHAWPKPREQFPVRPKMAGRQGDCQVVRNIMESCQEEQLFKSTQTTLWEYKVRQSTKSGYCPF